MPQFIAVFITALTLLFSSQLTARTASPSFSSLSSIASPLVCAEDDKKDDKKKKKEGEEEEPDCD